MFLATSVASPLKQQAFDDLCQWIELHLAQPIGWQELMQQSGLDYQMLQSLFFNHANTTPMTWIRRRREAGAAQPKTGRPILSPVQKPGLLPRLGSARAPRFSGNTAVAIRPSVAPDALA